MTMGSIWYAIFAFLVLSEIRIPSVLLEHSGRFTDKAYVCTQVSIALLNEQLFGVLTHPYLRTRGKRPRHGP